MKGTKEQRGITLIALIITIVVLLILAAVAISSISNDGILHYAQNAADSWNKAQTNEGETLDSYLSYMCGINGHNWGATDEKIENSSLFWYTCSNCGLRCNHEEYDYIGSGWYDDFYHEIQCLCQCGMMWPDYSLAEHIYDDSGCCIECGDYCTHEDYVTTICVPSTEGCVVNGVCDACGKTLESTVVEHEIDESNVSYSANGNECIATVTCSNCGAQGTRTETHELNDDLVCSKCGYECNHQFNTEGVCTVCGGQCQHTETTEINVRYGTGDEMTHDIYFDIQCVICKAIIEQGVWDCSGHIYENGVCNACGRECTHYSGLTNVTYSYSDEGCLATGNCWDCGMTGTIIEEHELDESNLTYSANGNECIATGNCSKCGTTGTRIEEHGYEYNTVYTPSSVSPNMHYHNDYYYCPKCNCDLGDDWYPEEDCSFDSNGKCTLCGQTKTE